MQSKDIATVHTDLGYRTGLVVTVGPKWVSMIYPDSSGVRITKLDKRMKFTVHTGYSIAKAKRHLRRCGRNFGITKSAKKALRGAA